MPPVNCEITLLFLLFLLFFPFSLVILFFCVILCYFGVIPRVHPFPTIFEIYFSKFSHDFNVFFLFFSIVRHPEGNQT